jgi:hypothetical protein
MSKPLAPPSDDIPADLAAVELLHHDLVRDIRGSGATSGEKAAMTENLGKLVERYQRLVQAS